MVQTRIMDDIVENAGQCWMWAGVVFVVILALAYFADLWHYWIFRKKEEGDDTQIDDDGDSWV